MYSSRCEPLLIIPKLLTYFWYTTQAVVAVVAVANHLYNIIPSFLMINHYETSINPGNPIMNHHLVVSTWNSHANVGGVSRPYHSGRGDERVRSIGSVAAVFGALQKDVGRRGHRVQMLIFDDE